MANALVDRLAGLNQGVALKAPVRAVATTNLTLSGFQTVDGEVIIAADDNRRVLCTAQTAGSDNGIWIVNETAWSRAADMNGQRDVLQGTLVLVQDGTVYQLTTPNPITINTTSLTFTPWGGGGGGAGIGADVYAVDTGIANAYVITLDPAPTIEEGLTIKVKALNANTGASTIAINGAAPVSMTRPDGTALVVNDIVAGGIFELTYDGTDWQVAGGAAGALFDYYAAGSGTNTITATLSPAPTIAAGTVIFVMAANSITGAATLNINGGGALAIKRRDGTDVRVGDILANQIFSVAYTGSLWELMTIQGADDLYAVATGTNTIAATLSPSPTLGAGVVLYIMAANSITGAATLAVNGGSAIDIKRPDGSAVRLGDIVAGQIFEVRHTGTVWQLESGIGKDDDYAVDSASSGTVYAIALDPAPTLVAGTTIRFKASTTGTGGATTIAINGGSAVSIKRPDGQNPLAGDIVDDGIHQLTHDGTNWVVAIPPMNINGLTTETTVDGTADFIAIHDTSAGSPRKTLFQNISGIALGELKVKYVSDEGFVAAGPETCFTTGTTLIGTINRGTWLNGIYTATASTRLFVCATIHYQSLAAGGNILAEIMTDTGSPLAVGRSITYNDSGSARPADVVVAALVSLTNTQQVYIRFTPSANGTVESNEEFTNLNIIELG